MQLKRGAGFMRAIAALDGTDRSIGLSHLAGAMV